MSTPISEQEVLPAGHAFIIVVTQAEELPKGIIELIEPPANTPVIPHVEDIAAAADRSPVTVWRVG